MSHPCFYGDIINKAKKLKSDTCKNLICKGYDSTTIVDCLMQAFFAKNIDNLLILLVGPISN